MDFSRKKYKKSFFKEKKFDVEVVTYEEIFNLRAGKLYFAKYKKNFFKKIEAFFYSGSFLFSELGLKNENQNQKHIQNLSIFATLVYTEPQHIQAAGIFTIQDIFRNLSNIYGEALCKNS